MPKRTTSNGKPQLECSDGAKMLIDQMKEHPEEFKGYAGKFTALLDRAHDVLHNSASSGMSQRDAAAILDAAEEHLYEVWLAEDVLTKIMQPKPEPEQKVAYSGGRGTGKSVLSGAIANSIYSSGNVGASNTSTSQYIAQAYRMERERYEQEEFKRREHERAIRNTKPFTGFL